MKGFRSGFTLVEVMASTVVLVVLLAVIAQAMGVVQRSWLSVRTAAEVMRNADAAQSTLRSLAEATLRPRVRYDETLDQLVPESDLHFVCGPCSELLPNIQGACGDAVFFQRPTSEVSLHNVLQACGVFVQYGDDDAWRPGFVRNSGPRLRFRLLQFHQPADVMPLFQPATALPDSPSKISTLFDRRELYGWFATPAATSADSLSIVAENIVAMTVQALPGSQRCYDTRKRQWEGDTAEARESLHRLPQALDLTLLMTDEPGWARLSTVRAAALASALIKQVRTVKPGDPASLASVANWLEQQGLRAQTFRVSVSLFSPDAG